MTSPDSTLTAAVRLTVPAQAENVALARQVIAGVAEGLDIEDELLADINIAVTEACNNIVLHAYPGGAGSIEVTITSVFDQLLICVRDQGAGMNPFPAEPADDPAARTGFGMAMMSSLADQFGIVTGSSGTEVRMRFALRGRPAPDAEDLFERERAGFGDADSPLVGDIDLVLTRGAPAAAVLARFISLLAARARLSIDRMSDLQMVSDALALHAPRRALDGSFHVSAAGDESGFDLRIGPLQAGGSEAMIQDTTLTGVGSLLHVLSDSVTSEPWDGAPGAEVLRLRLTRLPAAAAEL